jgi:uncharacterized protein YacL
MTLLIIRTIFLILCGFGAWAIAQMDPDWAAHPVIAVMIGLAGGLALIGIDYALKGFSLRGLSAATFGIAIGSLVSWFIGSSVMFQFVDEFPRHVAQIVLFVVCAYLGMVIALRGKDEFNLVIPYVKFTRQDKPEQIILLDTNVIIDGRVIDLCQTGFLEAVLVVPKFVLNELQYIADSAEPTRRARGRRGLEVLGQLRKNPKIEVKIHDNEVPDEKEVDAKLIRLARMLNAKILTNDYNLNKIAELQHVPVLNLNELAAALRPVVLPGQEISVRLIKEGREPHQAVGYLADGTMIVVNQARALVGQQVDTVIESVMQTSAGRLVFAQIKKEAAESAPKLAPNYSGRASA